MDKIIIQGLQVKSLIGVYDWEREAKQPLLIDIELSLDLRTAGTSDDVKDTIDYAALAFAVEEIAFNSKFQLLEALANHIIQHLLSYSGVKSAKISLSKPNILPNANAVTVELFRENP
ncbi:dihydroneopterin aldolase [Aliiglaciecola sp. 3_MG-2023]|uniref:dihydroneopterin aldolase n=1 Tax=Aliiglaciecola sp. 3_MG-2023 TaxID=3062644 RepID=UPI0026E376B1|nr:dihydroneopterin aldolase [Aliiglaciecola sp. 3_MG-2023]MDO6692911.1 dihydroneopterin aldolase [Aliiglaciecola sp. 3_MG-2023]